MKKKTFRTFLCLMLFALLSTCIFPIAMAESPAKLPDSVLYYGSVEEIGRNADGTIEKLRLSSDRYGEYVMNLSEETVWVDSGEKIASDPATLVVGEKVYVYHSAVTAQSLPPQSTAYAIVRNIPQDARCAEYLKVDSVKKTAAGYTIIANNETETFTVDDETRFTPYLTRNIVTARDLKADSKIIVWYSFSPTTSEAHAAQIMLLPTDPEEESGCPITEFFAQAKNSVRRWLVG